MYEIGLRAAAGANLFAFEVGQAVDFAVAEQHLRRVGGNPQQLDVRAFLAIELGVHGREGIDDGPRCLGVRCQSGQIDRFIDRVVRGKVRQGRGTELDHTLRHQAQHFRPFQAHFIEALDIGGDFSL